MRVQGMYGAMTDGVMMGIMTTIFAALFNQYYDKAFLAAGALSALGALGALVLSRMWSGEQLKIGETVAVGEDGDKSRPAVVSAAT